MAVDLFTRGSDADEFTLDYLRVDLLMRVLGENPLARWTWGVEPESHPTILHADVGELERLAEAAEAVSWDDVVAAETAIRADRSNTILRRRGPHGSIEHDAESARRFVWSFAGFCRRGVLAGGAEAFGA